MLEVTARDGRGRTATWKAPNGASLVSPTLIFPETSFSTAPAWIQAILTAKPAGRKDRIELVSGGTWFYPTSPGASASSASASPAADAKNSLVVAPPQPAPTKTIQVLEVGTELAVFHDAAGWASNPANLVSALIEARRTATPGRLLWAPGLGTPQDYALWAYLGVDLFDASPLLLAAAQGQALTTDGPVSAQSAATLLEEATMPAEPKNASPKPWDTARLTAWNLEAARRELLLVQDAIRSGTLRFLVERRIYAKPASVELLRRFDREYAYLEAATPHHRVTPLPCMTVESLWMPEVESFRRRFRDDYQPPASAEVLVLFPCSARKPYKLSRSHRIYARALDDSGMRHRLHEVMITSPLGLVPRELEDVYPANQYDIPVTGHWTRDEESIVKEQLAALLDKHEYKHVIVHASQATFDVLRHLLPENTRHTVLHHPTAHDDIGRLRSELNRLKGELGRSDAFAGGRHRKLDDIAALASFQFGAEVAKTLLAGSHAHGHVPYVKLESTEGPVAMTTAERGFLSLAPAGAAALARSGTHRVFIQDFKPKGTSSLFAVGVDKADPGIRPGDEVVVMFGDKIRGSGVAQMSSEEMAHLERGIAVTLRHTPTSKPAATVVTSEVVAQ